MLSPYKLSSATITSIVAFLLTCFCNAQQSQSVDSLLAVIEGDVTDRERVAAYVQLAESYDSKDPRGIGFAAKAVEISNQIEDPSEKIEAKIGIGKMYNLTGRYSSADSLFAEVIALSTERGFLLGKLEGYLGYAQSQYYLGVYEEALRSYDEAITINRELDDDTTAISIYNGIGNILYKQGQYDNSTSYYLKSVAIAKSIGDKTSLSYTYQKLGKNCRFQSRYEEALEYYLASVKIAHEINDNELLAILYNNLGLLHADHRESEQAIEYYLKSIDLEDQVSDRTIALDAYFNLAGSYSDIGEFDKALEYLNIVYDYDKETNYVWGQALDLNYIGTIHFRQEEYRLALDYYLESLNLFKEIGAEGNYMDPMIRIATAYMELNQLDIARTYLKDALNYANKTGLVEYKIHVFEYLAQLEEKARNFKGAYESHQLYKRMADSLANQQEIKKIAKLEAEFEFQQEKDSLDFIREKDLLAFNAEIEKKTTIQQGTLIGLVVVLLLSLTIYYLYAQRTKSNRKLRKTLGENNLLIKEIHHRVKNNLQIISSLLNLQTNFLEDEKAKSAVRNIQSRVLSMAVVHQSLYKGKEITHVYADEYFEHLIRSVKNTFDDNENPVTINKELDHVRIPSDYAVNIGLITNEIITNSLKHAFPSNFKAKKEIYLGLNQGDEEIRITLKDNGIGMEKPSGSGSSGSYGWHLVQTLTNSMLGKLNVENSSGTCIRITLPLQHA